MFLLASLVQNVWRSVCGVICGKGLSLWCLLYIALETIHRAVSGLDRLGYVPEVTQISVSRTKTAGGLHLLMAQNPVFLITGAQT